MKVSMEKYEKKHDKHDPHNQPTNASVRSIHYEHETQSQPMKTHVGSEKSRHCNYDTDNQRKYLWNTVK